MVMTMILSLALLLSSVFFLLRHLFLSRRTAACYIVDYVCLRPPDALKISTEIAGDIVLRNTKLGLDDYKFLLRIMVSSGIGEATYVPQNILDGREESATHGDALHEMDTVFFPLLDDLFARTGASPESVDAVVVNVSMFAPAPSLAARIVNKYGMRDDTVTYNLAGMGCSASIPAMQVVSGFFASRGGNSGEPLTAVVVSTETIGSHWYSGGDRSMMVGNCLFRVGGSAMLLTNAAGINAHRRRAKFKLRCIVRTHSGASDEAYGCAFQTEDEEGQTGFKLSKKLVNVAGDTLARNLRALAPKILPVTELLRYAVAGDMINLKKGVDHLCIHAGGSAVIDSIGATLRLSPYDLEPSRMTLHRWGNTSASTLWYSLAYMEAKGRLKKGDKVVMMGLGAGFEGNTCVLEVAGDGVADRGAWDDVVDDYPPASLVNPFSERYGWIHGPDADLQALRFLQATNRSIHISRLAAAAAAPAAAAVAL